MITHLKSLNWLPVKVRSTYNISCFCYHCHNSTAPSYVADMLQKKPTFAPAHTPCLFSTDLHTVRQHFVIACFFLLLLLLDLYPKRCQVCPITVIIYVSLEDVLVSFGLQRLNCLFQLLYTCVWFGKVIDLCDIFLLKEYIIYVKK